MEIENLIDIFSAQVVSNKSELNDFSKGSVLYTIARAVALTVNEVYQEIETLKESSLLIGNNTDINLLKSISPSLDFRLGTKSKGYVLVTNLDESSLTIEKNTPLTDPISTNQFFTTETKTVDNISETQIEIEAGDIGADYNLLAGKTLINVNLPRLIFTVGKYRELDGTIKGDLTGGSPSETVSQLQQRVKDKLLNLRVTGRQALIDYLLSIENIKKVDLETLRGGLVNIWINSTIIYSDAELTQLNDSLQDYLPVGVMSNVKQLITKSLNVRLQVFEQTNYTVDILIESIVKDYIHNILPNNQLSRATLRNLISERTGIVVKILEPLDDVLLGYSEKFDVLSVEVLNAI